MTATVSSAPTGSARSLVLIAGAVLLWFAVAEVATYTWYWMHESKLPRNPVPASGEEVVDRIHRFASDVGFEVSERDIGSQPMDILKCSFGKTVIWSGFSGNMSAVTVLKWDERSVVGGVESMHNPGACLGAAGWTVGARTPLGVKDYGGVTCEVTKWDVSRDGSQMQAYSAVFRRYSEFAESGDDSHFSNESRLRSVFSGRRDAPVMILLAYLPAESSDSRLVRIMNAIFSEPQK